MSSSTSETSLLILGAGGMGAAIARRVGVGAHILLSDRDEGRLAALAQTLTDDGHRVSVRPVDITSAESVDELAAWAAGRGRLMSVVHTAGVSPAMASVEAILHVDLLGTALVLDAFAPVVEPGGAGVFIASMAGHLAGDLGQDVEHALALTPTDRLLALPLLASPEVVDNPAWAYMVAKRGNQLRVKAAARQWGLRGARVNSISPGVIATSMGRAELEGDSGAVMRQLVAESSTGRLGTPDDIAVAAEFLLGPLSSFVTGTDLLVDGGVCASLLKA